ncbi:hypothetical protein RND81_10G046000 [Saponaria officinalis]|uniref:Uncharacterized protein n=1 Tax=Saponaria officinalis TaxID=3572 RepID=A0AAW1HYB5_SAPOF
MEPRSVVARLLKARYFPNSSLLKASVGRHPSYIWQSLMEARWVLNRECRWLIGDGRSINFLSDLWTLKGPTFRVWSPRFNVNDSCVADWIEGDCWDVTKIRNHLMEDEASEVLKIPICANGEGDRLVWH